MLALNYCVTHRIHHSYSYCTAMAGWKTKNNNSSTTESDLWRNAGPGAFKLQENVLKSHKIRSACLVVNCVGLRTFWMPLVPCLLQVLKVVKILKSYSRYFPQWWDLPLIRNLDCICLLVLCLSAIHLWCVVTVVLHDSGYYDDNWNVLIHICCLCFAVTCCMLCWTKYGTWPEELFHLVSDKIYQLLERFSQHQSKWKMEIHVLSWGSFWQKLISLQEQFTLKSQHILLYWGTRTISSNLFEFQILWISHMGARMIFCRGGQWQVLKDGSPPAVSRGRTPTPQKLTTFS